MQGLLDYIITRDTELEEWTYDPKSRRYRNKRTGRYMSHDAIVRSRDRYIEHRSGVVNTLVSEVLDGAADVPVGSPAWHSMISQLDRIGWWEVESTFITAYVYGKGGINNMGAADYSRLNTMLSNQRRYWDGFMADIGSGQVTIEVKISTRMNMYTSNARSFHARGMASAWDMVLPTYPGEQDCGPNCFVPGTQVEANGINGSMRRWYEGGVVTVLTGSGRKFTVTPNHPIAGEHGWILAGQLREGDNLLSTSDGQWPTLGDPDIQNGNPTIQQVHDALAEGGVSLRMSGGVMDFHGEKFHGDVDVVSVEGDLRSKVNTSLTQSLADNGFSYAYVNAHLAPLAERTGREVVIGSNASTHCIVCGTRIGEAFLGSHSPHAEDVGFRSSTGADPRFTQSFDHCSATDPYVSGDTQNAVSVLESSDDVGGVDLDAIGSGVVGGVSVFAKPVSKSGAANPQTCSDAIDRFSGLVSLDRIVNIEWNEYAGHVYNLETEGEWYVANGIIVHNCRCSWKIREAKEGVEAYWVLGSRVNNCDGCLENADMYNPYLVEREEGTEA